jgi:hypothetical protein
VEDIEHSADFFDPLTFGAVVAATANGNYARSSAVQRASAARIAAAEVEARGAQEKAAKKLAASRAALARLQGEHGGDARTAKLQAAVSEYEAQVAALEGGAEARAARARGVAREACGAELALAMRLAADVASVEVRRMNCVFVKRGAREET